MLKQVKNDCQNFEKTLPPSQFKTIISLYFRNKFKFKKYINIIIILNMLLLNNNEIKLFIRKDKMI